MSLLTELIHKVNKLEQTVGSNVASAAAAKDNDAAFMIKKTPGIDVVLGAQWGDEGKGKLVDVLSQVRVPYVIQPTKQTNNNTKSIVCI
jgi:Adenylosuccinate synthetase